MRLGEGLYRTATATLSPLIGLLMTRRVQRGRESGERLNERYARHLPSRPEGRLAWLHGASVGESLMLLELGRKLLERYPDLHIVFTSQTQTSAALMAQRLPARTFHQMAPIDTPAIARRFIAHWQPELVVMAEGEIWPNLTGEADKSGASIALVNARMTRKTLDGWRRWPQTAQRVFARFDLMLAADTETAEGLSELAGREVILAGNLKSALPAPTADPFSIEAIRKGFIGPRPCLVAASTHPGEEDLLIAALVQLEKRPAIILAPRHPERGEALAHGFREAGFATAQRSKGEPATLETDILLADTLGELGLWYSLADLVYLGGGHGEGIGGHNPLEPVRLGRTVLTGPKVHNFRDVMERLEQAGALERVDADAFPARLGRAIADGLAPPSPQLLEALESEAQAPMETSLAALRKLFDERGTQ